MDGFIINLISIFVLFLLIVASYYFKLKIRPIALAENDAQFVERQLNNMTENIRNSGQIEQLPVRELQNPFLVELNSSKSSVKDGIYFKIKKFSNNISSVNLLIGWIVDINKFYSKLENSVNDTFYSDSDRQNDVNFFVDCCEFLNTEMVNLNDENKEFHYKIPNECNSILDVLQTKDSVRNVYHLVLTIYHDKKELDSLNSNDIIANVSIYHLKDNKMETRLIHNYLKCLNNQIISLVKIKVEDESLCVICQTTQSDQVLLPCTHKCVCSDCLKRIPDRKCPLCRTVINNKFELIN